MAPGKKKTTAHGPKNIFVISGKDRFLAQTRCNRLLDELLPESERATGLFQPEPDNADVAEVLDDLRTPSLFGSRRVVLIKDADDFVQANRSILEKYFENPDGKNILILVVENWDKRTKLAKMLVSAGELVDAGEIKPRDIPQYAVQTARNFGKEMSFSTARMLVALVGDDVGRVTGEIEKLSIYVDQRKGIQARDVEFLAGHNRIFNVFEVIDCVTDNDIPSAMAKLRTMFAMNRDAEYTVVGGFAYHFRRMFSAKAMITNGSGPVQIAAQMKIYWNREGFFRQLSRFTLGQIGWVLCELARTDFNAKTGRSDIQAAMERLVFRLQAVLKQA